MARHPRKLMPLEGATITRFDKYLEVIISPSESDIERHYVSHCEGEKDKLLKKVRIEKDEPIKSEERQMAPATKIPSVEMPKKRKPLVSLASKKQARSGKPSSSSPSMLQQGISSVFPRASDEDGSAQSLDSAVVAKRKVKKTTTNKRKEASKVSADGQRASLTSIGPTSEGFLEPVIEQPDVGVHKELDTVKKLSFSLADVKSAGRKSSIMSHKSNASTVSTRFKALSTEADLAENILEAMFNREIVKDTRDNLLEISDVDSSQEQSKEISGQVENLDGSVSGLLTTQTQQKTLADQSVTQKDDTIVKLPREQGALPKLTKVLSVKRKTPKPQTETEPDLVETDASMTDCVPRTKPLTESETWLRESLMRHAITKVGAKKKRPAPTTERKPDVKFKVEKKSLKKSSQDVTAEKDRIEKKLQDSKASVTPKPGRKDFDKARALMEQKADTKADSWLKDLMSQRVLLQGQKKRSLPQPASQTDGLEIPLQEKPSTPSEEKPDWTSSSSSSSSSTETPDGIFMESDRKPSARLQSLKSILRESRRKSSFKPPAETVWQGDEELQGMKEQFFKNRQRSQDAHRTALERSYRRASRHAKKELLPETLRKPSQYIRSHAPAKCASVDPRTLVENYMNNKHVYELFQYLTGKLILDAPHKPLDYLIDLVRTIDTSQGLSGVSFCS